MMMVSAWTLVVDWGSGMVGLGQGLEWAECIQHCLRLEAHYTPDFV
jgi:hypothetical protein